MLEEPFWLGLITITIVLVVIAIVWCVKRHFAEKFDNFVTQEFERGKLVEPAMMDWARGRQISAHCLNIEAVSSSPQLSANVIISCCGFILKNLKRCSLKFRIRSHHQKEDNAIF